MTYVKKRGIFLGGWLFAVWEGRVGMGRRRRNRGGEGRQSGDVLTFIDGITDGLIPLVMPLAILSVSGSCHCMEIPV